MDRRSGMKKLLAVTALALAALLALAFTGAALAQTVEPKQRREKLEEQRREKLEDRAKRIEDRIDLIMERFNTKKDRHVATCKRIKARLEQVIENLSAKGYDTGKLSEDLGALDEKIAEFAKGCAALMEKLEDARKYAAGESGGDFREAMQAARAQMRVVREDVMDIKKYYRTVMKPDIQALKSQKPATEGPAPDAGQVHI